MEMEDQLTPTQIKIIAGWSHNYPCLVHKNDANKYNLLNLAGNNNLIYCVNDAISENLWPLLRSLFPRNTQALKGLVCFEFLTLRFALLRFFVLTLRYYTTP